MLLFVTNQLKQTREMVVLETLFVSILFIASILTLFINPTKKLILPWLTSKKPPSSKPSKNIAKCEEEKIKQAFRTFDKNKDGFITKEELGQSLKQMGIDDDDDELGHMFEKLDLNGDGLIDLEEFSRIFDVTSCLDEEEELKEAFDVFDGDRDGLISVAELGVVLENLGMKEGEREDCCREMIRKVDVDGDGMVSFLEFKNMMSSSQSHGVKSTLVPAF